MSAVRVDHSLHPGPPEPRATGEVSVLHLNLTSNMRVWVDYVRAAKENSQDLGKMFGDLLSVFGVDESV